MVNDSVLRRPKWIPNVVACVLLTAFAEIVVPANGASSASPFHINLTMEDPTSGGPITQNDSLIIFAQVFKNGVRARSGEIVVSSDTPVKRFLCEIDSFPYSHDSCRTRLPEAGLWQIVARLSSSVAPPWHYVASVSLSVNVMPDGIGDN
jgi:hypothetical protein